MLELVLRRWTAVAPLVLVLASAQAVAGVTPPRPLGLHILSQGPSARPETVDATGANVAGINIGTATIWRPSGQTIPLTGSSSNCYGLNVDGSVAVGLGPSGGFRWTQAGGAEVLAPLPFGSDTVGNAVSADGSIVAGTSRTQLGYRAVRWTTPQTPQSLGTLEGGTFSDGLDVSADGSRVVGYSGTSGGHARAFLWTDDGAGGHMQSLGVLGSHLVSRATAISGDGQVVVGYSTQSNASDALRAFRWTAETGMVPLGVLPGGISSAAVGASYDGSTILLSTNPSGSAIWRADLGLVPFGAYLESLGFETAGWNFTSPKDISADGLTMVGTGLFNGQVRGWVVVIPAPPTTMGIMLLVCVASSRRRTAGRTAYNRGRGELRLPAHS